MLNKATTTDTALSCNFINTLFEHTKQNIYVNTLANDENDKTHGERYVITRVETEIADFVRHYDIPMRAIYFCVGTISASGVSSMSLKSISTCRNGSSAIVSLLRVPVLLPSAPRTTPYCFLPRPICRELGAWKRPRRPMGIKGRVPSEGHRLPPADRTLFA
jgi:hypothetical protein